MNTEALQYTGKLVAENISLQEENKRLKKQIEELKDVNKLLIYKENYEMLKKEIESLHNAFLCCEMTLDFSKEVEEI